MLLTGRIERILNRLFDDKDKKDGRQHHVATGYYYHEEAAQLYRSSAEERSCVKSLFSAQRKATEHDKYSI